MFTGRLHGLLKSKLGSLQRSVSYLSYNFSTGPASISPATASLTGAAEGLGPVPLNRRGQFLAASLLPQQGYVQPAYADLSDEEHDALQPQSQPSKPRRSGVLAVKAGMTHAWDEDGVRIPLTVLWIDTCQVQHSTFSTRGHG